MAPFKLKFRMGSSRSTSQECEAEPPVQPLLGNGGGVGGGGGNSTNSTITSSTATINSEFNSLGSIGSNNDQRNLIPCNSNDERTGYTNPTLTQNFIESSNIIPQSPPPSYEHVLEENRIAGLDRDNNPTTIITHHTSSGIQTYINSQMTNISTAEPNLNENTPLHNRIESIESPVFLYSNMTTPSQEDLLGNIGSCDPLFSAQSEEQIDLGKDDCEENVSNEHDRCSLESDNMENNNSDEDWDSHEHQSQEMQPPDVDTIINNKSSKEIYKAVAKQWGITCKMSEQCRCIECQSNYFDCEFDENEHQKTDGGLGATTPMFISEVMHGTACSIL